ncbi:MAG: CrcB family protein [Ilumatobacteraceae bacterium]
MDQPRTPSPEDGADRTGSGHHVSGDMSAGLQMFDRGAPTSPLVLCVVALGGALGASGRWAVGAMFDAVSTPQGAVAWGWATLIVNVVGAFLIGIVARRMERDTMGWAFTVTGVLGGFTTFSAFAMSINDLADADRMALAIGYGAVTLLAGIGATLVAHGVPLGPAAAESA